MAHHTAVHGGKNGFQRLIFADQFPLIRLFFGHVNPNAHGSHYAAIQIIQRRLICGEYPLLSAGLNNLLGNKGLLGLHNNTFRLDTGRIILFHVPDIGVAPSLHLGLGLVYRSAEAVVHFLMNAVFIFIPDQIRRAVDRSLQVLARLPVVHTAFTALLPTQEMKPQFGIRHGQSPDVCYLRQDIRQAFRLSLFEQQDQFRFRTLFRCQHPGGLRGLHTPQIGPNHVCFCGKRRV